MGKVVLPKAVAAPVLGVAPDVQPQVVRPTKPVDPDEATDQPDLRLMIEESEDAEGVIYLVVDRRTGRVVRRFSREEVLRLRDQSSYAAGAVFNGKA